QQAPLTRRRHEAWNRPAGTLGGDPGWAGMLEVCARLCAIEPWKLARDRLEALKSRRRREYRDHPTVPLALEAHRLTRLAEARLDGEHVRHVRRGERRRPGWIVRIEEGELPVAPLEADEAAEVLQEVEADEGAPLLRQRRRRLDQGRGLTHGLTGNLPEL